MLPIMTVEILCMQDSIPLEVSNKMDIALHSVYATILLLMYKLEVCY